MKLLVKWWEINIPVLNCCIYNWIQILDESRVHYCCHLTDLIQSIIAILPTVTLLGSNDHSLGSNISVDNKDRLLAEFPSLKERRIKELREALLECFLIYLIVIVLSSLYISFSLFWDDTTLLMISFKLFDGSKVR